MHIYSIHMLYIYIYMGWEKLEINSTVQKKHWASENDFIHRIINSQCQMFRFLDIHQSR